MVFCHIRFHNWTKDAFKLASKVFWLFREAVDCPLYVLSREDDEKFDRFVRRFGFTPFTRLLCNDGRKRRLYISLKDNSGHGLMG